MTIKTSTSIVPSATNERESAMSEPIDVIELLERDHRLISELVAQLEATDDPAEIRHAYLRIVEELSAHEAVEHEVVFPAFHRAFVADGDDTLSHRIAEHEELNDMLAEMRCLAPDCFAFTKRGSALLLELKGHFEDEEETVFSRMRAEFTTDALVEMGARAMVVKQHSPAFPVEHPTAVANSTTG
jgi:iron-sulfur cluster repair protein YtfE (RIC family)